MIVTGTPVFQARRIEAGLLNTGSDFGNDTTPFDAGFGAFVEFNHHDFVGRVALEAASRECRTWGMRVKGGVARLGRYIFKDGEVAGRICSSSYSPYQDCGVCIVRMDDPAHGPGTKVEVAAMDDQRHGAELCTLPMYDPDRLIPRGKLVDIPDCPTQAA